MVSWQERLRQEAEAAVKVEKNVGSGSKFIKTRGGKFTLDGGTADKLEVVILDHILENAWYEGRFDPDTPSPPSCFALGREEDELVPHENVAEPVNEKCKGCPYNEFESSDTGRGKACKNTRRLALLSVADVENLETIPDAEIALLKIPVTSVGNWATYVKKLKSSYDVPPLGVLTEITLSPDSKSQFKMSFRMLERIEDGDLIEALFDKKDTIQDDLEAPYQAVDPEERAAKEAKPGKAHGKAPAKAAAAPAKAAAAPAKAGRLGRR